MIDKINEYLNSVKKRDPAASSSLGIPLTYTGVKTLFFHRAVNFFWKAKIHLLARIISQFSRFLTSIEIHPAATLEKNF